MMRRPSEWPRILLLASILITLLPSIVSSRPSTSSKFADTPKSAKNESLPLDVSKLLASKVTNQVNLLSAKQNATATTPPPPSSATNKNSTQLAKSASSVTPVRVNSKTGRAIARMQGKRQVDENGGPSRRQEDPWFLDLPPYPLQPYRFAYNVKGKNGQTEQYRQEVGDGKFLTGSYGYVLPDGIYRHVDYVADDQGFRAYIRTSEPGTANQNPANVVIDSNPVPVIPGVTYALGPRELEPATFPPSNPYDYSTLRSSDQLVRRPPGAIVGTPVRNFTSFSFPSSVSQGSLWPPLLPAQSKTTGGSLDSQRPIAAANSTLAPPSTWLGSQVTTDDSVFSRIKPEQNFTQNFGPLRATLSSLPEQQAPRYLDNYSGGNPRSGPSVLTYDRPFNVQNNDLSPPKLSYDHITNHVVANPNYWNRLALERAQQITNLGLLNPSSFNSYLRPLAPPLPASGETQFGTLSPLVQSSGHLLHTGSSSSESSRDSYRKSQHEHLDPDFNRVVVTKEHRSGFKNATGRDFELHNQEPDGTTLLPPPPPIFPPRPQGDGVKGGGAHGPSRPEHQFNNPQFKQSDYTNSDQQQVSAGPPLREPAHELQQQITVITTASPPVSPLDQQQVDPDDGARQSTKSNRQNEYLAATQSPTFGPMGVKGANWSPEQPHRDQVRAQPPPPPPPPVRTIRMPQDYRSSLMMNDLRSMQQVIGLPQPPRLHRLAFPRSVPPTSALNEERLDAGLNLADQIVTSRLNHVDALLSGRSSPSDLPHLPVPAPPPPPPPPPPPLSPVILPPRDFQPIGPAGQSASSIQPSIALKERELPSLSTQKPPKSSITKRVLSGKIDSPVTTTTTTTTTLPITPTQSKKRTATTSGSLSKLTSPEDSRGGFSLFESLAGPSNETSFEAQRLVKAAKLQAEKVSELEKFQQRLRTQQLLLEQLKNPDKLGNKTTSGSRLQPQARPSELNLHVRYDDANDNANAIDSQQSGGLQKLGPQVGRDYSRLRRQNEAEVTTRPLNSTTTSTTTTTTTTKPPVSSTITTTTTTTRPTVIRKLPEAVETIDLRRRPDLSKVNATTLRLLSDLAQHIQRWPSVIQNQNKTLVVPNQQQTNLVDHGRVLKAFGSSQSNDTAKARSLEANSKPTDIQLPNNTINLDFINSVTALSVDQLNPFAMSSVNPGVQRSASTSGANESRLQPHKLESPHLSSSTTTTTSGPSVGIAIANARYISSPELLAAAGRSARHDYGVVRSDPAPATGGWASNHRFGDGAGHSLFGSNSAPYMMTGGSNNDMVKSMPVIVDTHKTAKIITTSEIRDESSLLPGSQQSNSRTMRDGFNIRDNAMEVGQQKFFEVVSSLRQPNEGSQFQAFRDPQLSISAVSRRRRATTG